MYPGRYGDCTVLHTFHSFSAYNTGTVSAQDLPRPRGRPSVQTRSAAQGLHHCASAMSGSTDTHNMIALDSAPLGANAGNEVVEDEAEAVEEDDEGNSRGRIQVCQRREGRALAFESRPGRSGFR